MKWKQQMNCYFYERCLGCAPSQSLAWIIRPIVLVEVLYRSVAIVWEIRRIQLTSGLETSRDCGSSAVSSDMLDTDLSVPFFIIGYYQVCGCCAFSESGRVSTRSYKGRL